MIFLVRTYPFQSKVLISTMDEQIEINMKFGNETFNTIDSKYLYQLFNDVMPRSTS